MTPRLRLGRAASSESEAIGGHDTGAVPVQAVAPVAGTGPTAPVAALPRDGSAAARGLARSHAALRDGPGAPPRSVGIMMTRTMTT